jgi:Inner membrane protein YgaP-like, transmembrane domain
MQKNESSVDRWLRLVIGIAVLSLVFVGPKTAWGLLGLIPLGTAVVGFCPLYRVFGITTRSCFADAHHGG